MNTDNSTYIQQNSKSFLGLYKDNRRICLMEKDGGKKSREGNVEGSYGGKTTISTDRLSRDSTL
jgi:hypothetical protein